jgi:integrase
VEKLAEDDFVRDILTTAECKAFFQTTWTDPRLYAANLLAATTGLRLGEVRGLGFHAWRHWYNSMLRGQVPDHALRALTGHRSEAMTDHYTEITAEQRSAVAALANQLF